MALRVTRCDVWAATVADRPGGLAEKLAALAKAGANLEMVIARRQPDKPGTAVVFVTPVKGAKQVKAAAAAGFSRAKGLHSVRAEGPDRPGMGAKMTQALAAARVNLRGLSAAALGKKCVVHIAVDTEGAAAKAAAVLKKVK